MNMINMSQKREYPRVREQLVDSRSRRTDTLPVSTVTQCQGTARLESVNAVITQNICAEGVALRWDRGATNAMQSDILLLFVAQIKRNTVNFERHEVYEVEREATKPYRGKAENDGTGPFVGDIESDRTKPQFETGHSTAFLSVVDCTEKKDAWFVTLKVKRVQLRFKIDTGANVTIITKKTWQ